MIRINKNSIFKVIQYILVLFSMVCISSCSTYPSKFKCGNAKGLGCTMLSEIDRQITSGQIEEAYKDKRRCRGRKCYSNKGQEVDVPKLKASHNTKILTRADDEDVYEYEDSGYLYIRD